MRGARSIPCRLLACLAGTLLAGDVAATQAHNQALNLDESGLMLHGYDPIWPAIRDVPRTQLAD